MSINNVSNVSDALKYVSGMEVSTKERSILSDAKDSIFNPITLVFGGLEVNSSLKNNLDAKNIKDVFEKVKKRRNNWDGAKSRHIFKKHKY